MHILLSPEKASIIHSVKRKTFCLWIGGGAGGGREEAMVFEVQIRLK